MSKFTFSMKSYLLITYVIFLIGLNSCATLFSGSTEEINLTSNPPMAKVTLNGTFVGKTPMKLTLNKGKSYIIEFLKEGFERQSLNMTYSIGGEWIVLDILGGLVAIIVDAATGNWNEYDVTDYNAQLEEKE